jgi:hypothetical protein
MPGVFQKWLTKVGYFWKALCLHFNTTGYRRREMTNPFVRIDRACMTPVCLTNRVTKICVASLLLGKLGKLLLSDGLLQACFNNEIHRQSRAIWPGGFCLNGHCGC